ncbi:MAG: alpha-L-fucosidase [candidate division KSB1 bacterium]|nr:alpha-L-fucosidase [candidate division KSB1 bacterium]
MKKIFTVFLLLVISLSAKEWSETPEQKAQRMQWWTEARFGMFIHWGLYAMAARHEWVKSHERISNEDYRKYFDLWYPDLYNPSEWAKAAKRAGMRYFVVTTKHHEGFCLWDSKYTDYKATNTPWGKDLLRPMVEAFRAEGLKVGFYYSLIDWHHPDFTVDRFHPMRDNPQERAKNKNRDMKRYAEYVYNQVKELMTEFGTIDCLFLDFSYPGDDGKGRNDWQSERLVRMIRELQPNIIINDRADLLDKPWGWDFRTPEQFMPREWVKVDGKPVPWETCQTFSGSWGYHRDEDTWKTPRQLVTMLIETVSKGGNLLLNVGPTARGTFDDRALSRLQAIGQWMDLHNRSIYGCTAAPQGFKTPQNCFLTYNPKTNRLYVHVLEWPFSGLHLEGYAGKIKYAQLLNDGSEITFSENQSGEVGDREVVTLHLPVKQPSVIVPVIELFLK